MQGCVTFPFAAPSLTLKNLSEELVDVIQWYVLGIKLNLPQSVLTTIEVNHPRDVERCRLEMLMKWLQRTPTASWRDIVQALYEMNLNSVAQRVQRVHSVPFTGIYSFARNSYGERDLEI